MALVLRGLAVVLIAFTCGCAVSRPGLTYIEPEYDYLTDPLARQQVQTYEQAWAAPTGADFATFVLP